jgi:hypothetical protein
MPIAAQGRFIHFLHISFIKTETHISSYVSYSATMKIVGPLRSPFFGPVLKSLFEKRPRKVYNGRVAALVGCVHDLYCYQRRGFRFLKQRQNSIHGAKQKMDLGSPMHLPRKRAALTIQQVKEIFILRTPTIEKDGPSVQCTSSSRSVAISTEFGVSPKAVRDIWNRRTWCKVTSTLFHDADFIQHNINAVRRCNERLLCTSNFKKVGRPQGSKDSKPRQRRYQQHRSFMSDNHHNLHSFHRPPEQKILSDSRCKSRDKNLMAASALQAEKACRSEPKYSAPAHHLYTEQEEEECSLNRTYPFFLQC